MRSQRNQRRRFQRMQFQPDTSGLDAAPQRLRALLNGSKQLVVHAWTADVIQHHDSSEGPNLRDPWACVISWAMMMPAHGVRGYTCRGRRGFGGEASTAFSRRHCCLRVRLRAALLRQSSQQTAGIERIQCRIDVVRTGQSLQKITAGIAFKRVLCFDKGGAILRQCVQDVLWLRRQAG